MWNSREGNERMRTKERIKGFLKYIEDTWLEYPDERFGQLLSNMGLSTDWNTEMLDQNIPHVYMREIQHWGTYNGDWTKVKLENVPVSKLSTDHINAILKTEILISMQLRRVFESELEYREILEMEMQLNIQEQRIQ